MASSSEYDGLQFGTRATCKSRKRLGKGKRSSVEEATVSLTATELRKKSIKTKNQIDDDIHNMPPSMATLPGIDKCFHGAKRGGKGIRGALDRSKSRVSLAATGAEMDYFESTLLKFDPLQKDRENTIQRHIDDNALSWLWRMQIDYNILLFGVGCKRSLMRKFVNEFLIGHQVLMIEGDSDLSANSNRVIKELLDGICHKILKRHDLWPNCLGLESYVKMICDCLNAHYGRELKRKRSHRYATNDNEDEDEDQDEEKSPVIFSNADKASEKEGSVKGSETDDQGGAGNLWLDAGYIAPKRSSQSFGVRVVPVHSSSRVADPKWGGRYSHAQPKLYIIVDGIDGESLQSDESQFCLSSLAACSSVSMIANTESLNAPILWNPQMLSKYRWANYHVPTYQSYAFNASESNSLGGGSKEFPGGSRALEYIFKSLTKRHEELVSILAKDAVGQYDSEKVPLPSDATGGGSTVAYRGINIDDLLLETARSVVARSMPELNTLLQELIDHKIVTKVYDSQRKLCVWINLPAQTLRKLAVVY